LHRFGQLGAEEHSAQTGKPGSGKIDRSGTTFWHLLLVATTATLASASATTALATTTAATVPAATTNLTPIRKYRRGQEAGRNQCQPPFTVSILHSNTPFSCD
jgi:hypothetical protein